MPPVSPKLPHRYSLAQIAESGRDSRIGPFLRFVRIHLVTPTQTSSSRQPPGETGPGMPGKPGTRTCRTCRTPPGPLGWTFAGSVGDLSVDFPGGRPVTLRSGRPRRIVPTTHRLRRQAYDRQPTRKRPELGPTGPAELRARPAGPTGLISSMQSPDHGPGNRPRPTADRDPASGGPGSGSVRSSPVFDRLMPRIHSQ